MENIYQAIILAIIQGLTEFLPVSSSAHLILVPQLLGWTDQGLAFDVAIHVGTLCSVILYFRHELKLMIIDWCNNIIGKKATKNSRLAWAIGFGTIPAGIAGLLFNHWIETYLRSTLVIAITTIFFGILLGIATIIAKQKRDEYQLQTKDIITIGCAQAIALIPGTSRSGITLTAGLFTGLTRNAAARYSFLLSIPIILLSGIFMTYKVYTQHAVINPAALITGFLVAAVSGYLCIDIFLKLLQRFGVMPFVIYRIILGIVLLAVFI